MIKGWNYNHRYHRSSTVFYSTTLFQKLCRGRLLNYCNTAWFRFFTWSDCNQISTTQEMFCFRVPTTRNECQRCSYDNRNRRLNEIEEAWRGSQYIKNDHLSKADLARIACLYNMLSKISPLRRSTSYSCHRSLTNIINK